MTGLLRNELGYQGLTFTDALEMQGVKKYFPDGEVSAQSLIAGNDMLCLPGDVEQGIQKIKAAITDKQLSWEDIRQHCRKVLIAKYEFGVADQQAINLVNLTKELNDGVSAMKKKVAENALTVLKQSTSNSTMLIKKKSPENTVAYVGIGISEENAFAKRMRLDHGATIFLF